MGCGCRKNPVKISPDDLRGSLENKPDNSGVKNLLVAGGVLALLGTLFASSRKPKKKG